jgi:hypothetical protein
MGTRIIYDETLPTGVPVLIIRAAGQRRILIHPSWEPIIAERGLEGACGILDEMCADLDQQDGTPQPAPESVTRMLRVVADGERLAEAS